MEDEKARHLPAAVAAARCRLWPPVATRPLAPTPPSPTASRLIPSVSYHGCSVCATTRPDSPRWNGSCFVEARRIPSMTSALAGKIVVVTGATGQAGWGIAHAALDTGTTVVLPVRSEAARKKV